MIELEYRVEESQENINFLYNGDIMNSLTGLFTLKYVLNMNKDFDWDYLKMILEQENYEKNNFKAIVLKTGTKVGKRKSKMISQISFLDEKTNLLTEEQRKSKHAFNQIFTRNLKKQEEVIQGFAYGLKDIFENQKFNMIYTEKPTEYEIILRESYSDLLKTKTQFIPKEKIIAIKKRSKFLKNKFKKFENNYIQKLRSPKQHKLVQIGCDML